MQFGLLGRKLGHSYSPQIHNLLADYAYNLYEVEPSNLKHFLNSADFHGLNVTIPYKKEVLTYCDDLSPIARKLGAVNTIIRRKDGTLYGHNTDYFGFLSMLDRSGLSVAGKKVLVLGSGGASNTICAVLTYRGARPIVISRTGENNYDNLHLHRDASVIVNTTPVGMYPDTGVSPVQISDFCALEGVLDVIYNPARTQLLLDAEEQGLITQNGLWMLVAQAKESAELFTGSSIDDQTIETIHTKLAMQMANTILIGMPGCGKSTIGQLLSKQSSKKFVDADRAIEETAGMTIPEIFSQQGESGFRQLETQVLARLGKESGLVIATGGGCVTRPENYPLLHQNGRIIWLKRNIEVLPTEGRPLSQSGDLTQMYQVREPLYRAFADIEIDNNDTYQETIRKIIAQEETL